MDRRTPLAHGGDGLAMETSGLPSNTDRLREIEALALELGLDDTAAEAGALVERVTEGRFFVACVGQFKRGKSTLLNALVGAPILPVGVAPVTAVVTVIRFGEPLSARVRRRTGDFTQIDPGSLAAYVSELENPENTKGITGVEVFVPSPLLRSGMCLVDTPGVGSVFAGNTEATKELVPHIDAALVVIGADPPIAGAELDLVVDIAKTVQEIIFALNKADRLTSEELEQGRAFAASVIEKRLGREPRPILEVSALEHIRSGAPTRQWSELERRLGALAEGRRSEMIRQAAARGVRRFGSRLLREVEERRGALLRPRDASVRRIEQLQATVAEAERMLAEMSYLFTAVQDDLVQGFEVERRAFMEKVRKEAMKDVEVRIDREMASGAKRAGPASMEHARRVARERVDAWRSEIAPAAEALYRRAGERFVELANGFLRRVADTTAPTLAALSEAFYPDTSFRTGSKFYFNELLALGDIGMKSGLAGALRGRGARIAAIKRDVGDYLLRLLETNSSRVANDIAEQVLESRRRLEADLRNHLRGAVKAAQRSLEQAAKTIEAGEAAVRAELQRLADLEARIQSAAGDL